ncbi:MAG: polysaccharide biosynthesis protein, partial [Armatimonadetes bacterium]|nr:polysaccharide biosynthesis protein [Armatimonadota bacterium]
MRTLTKITIDLTLIAASFGLAFAIRFLDQGITQDMLSVMARTLPFILAVRFGALLLISRYQPSWRYVSIHDLGLILTSTFLSSSILALLFYVWMPIGFPRSVLIIDTLLNVLLLVCGRLLFRLIFPYYYRKRNLQYPAKYEQRRQILIVGAERVGERIARDILQSMEWNLVGFVDYDPLKKGMRIHGRPVLGPLAMIPEILETHQIDDVLVAVPGITGSQLSDIVRLCEQSSARLSIVPDIDQVVNGSLPKPRELKLEDLLERDPIQLDTRQMRAFLSGERVLVTGAGGSIGSEICRQVAAMAPDTLILLGRGENSIHEAMLDLRSLPGITPIPVIASVEDPTRLRTVFEKYRPTVVFHAAAHKHVPYMEAHPEEAIKNNVFGTRNVVDLADEYGVKKFVLISTDKAVNPTSVMGASKRLAEMVIQAKARFSTTEYVAVRFGNVLGSRGSVVPTMQRQIEKGGPITVTHPEMTRYFMTIPEAVQLVLQAASMGRSGEVFVLDMGQPVKIIDLARNLIRLSGRVPDRDIAINIIGARPGEKLHEELMTNDEESVLSTQHSRIFVTRAQG